MNILAGGEPEREAAAFSQGAFNPNTAGKSFNDWFDNRQSQSGAGLVPAFLGCVERFENAGQVLGRNTAAGVDDFYNYIFFAILGKGYLQVVVGFHCFDGILDKVDQSHFEIAGISPEAGIRRLIAEFYADAVTFGFIIKQADGFGNVCLLYTSPSPRDCS